MALSYGVTPWHYNPSAPIHQLAGQAERAERLGFDSFWLPESHFAGPISNPAPLLLLAGVAARTQRLRIATTSFLLPIRNPLQMAEEVAVLDQLSEGRLILGVGRGFGRTLFAAYDVPAAEKRERFEASLEIMRAAWEGKPILHGENGKGVFLAPLPRQDPHPPIWVAAFGPKALALVGRLRLPYLASPMEPLATLRENYAAHRESLEAAGGAPEPLAVPVIRIIFAHPDREVRARASKSLEQHRKSLGRGTPNSLQHTIPAAIDEWAIIGEADEVADRIATVREQLGMTHLIASTQISASLCEREALEALETLSGIASQA